MPALQVVQLTLPDSAAYEPASQRSHTAEPTPEARPGKQLTQAASFEAPVKFKARPAAQAIQAVRARFSWYCPLAQRSQLVALALAA